MPQQTLTTATPQELNAQLNLWKTSEDGTKVIDFEADREAARQYHLQEVNANTRFFYSLKEKLEFLFDNDYYERHVWEQYGLTIDDTGSIVEDDKFEDVKNIYRLVYNVKHRFKSYMGALKFYKQYAMKSFDGSQWLERYEDRVVATALLLGRGDMDLAKDLASKIVGGLFQPATPTFGNAGKAQRGELVSCYLSLVSDDMESISKSVSTALQLSKRGGGVALNLSDVRESGAPIKNIEGQSSGVVPVMKILEDSFSYADQLGQRKGSGAVYLSVHHPDILKFLDTKRENADEKIRIKTLSLGVVISDAMMNAAAKNEDLYLFSPYSIMREYGKPVSQISISDMYEELIDNPNIRKTKTNARKLLQKIAEIQFESGYPYIMFEDTVNEANAIDGRVSFSNLCVTGDTKILTSAGYKTVEDLYHTQEDFDVVVDDRARFRDLEAGYGTSVVPSSKMFKTAENAEVFEVTTSNGMSIKATAWHKFFVSRDGEVLEVPLKDLMPGDDLLVQPLDQENIDDRDFTSPVTSIDPYGVEDVYDVTVDDGNSVIFNGIATHNCSEILQVSEPATFNEEGHYDHEGRDISCNLGSMNIDNVMRSGDLESTVHSAIRALSAVSDLSDLKIVPPIRRGNELSHAIGLGQMSLASFFLRMGWEYGSQISLDFTNAYFMAVAYHAYKTSNMIAMERGETFYEFEKSKYADPAFLTEKYREPENIEFSDAIHDLFDSHGIDLPTSEDWAELAESIAEHGLYNAYLQAVPPTGSISYINNASASIHPFTDPMETRKEGMTGRVYYPQPNVTSENFSTAENAYDVGYKKLIDVYAEATKHVDQGLSLTLFFKDSATTRDINRAQIYAWKKGIKTLYYIRLSKGVLAGTEASECVSCAL